MCACAAHKCKSHGLKHCARAEALRHPAGTTPTSKPPAPIKCRIQPTQQAASTASTSTHLPCLQHAVLQCTSVAEGHVPWVGALVHGVQVECGLQLGLAAGQEHDAGHGRGHAALQHAQGVGGNGLRGALVGVISTCAGMDEGRQQHKSVRASHAWCDAQQPGPCRAWTPAAAAARYHATYQLKQQQHRY